MRSSGPARPDRRGTREPGPEPQPRRSQTSRTSTRRSTRTWRPSATASGNCRPGWTPRTPGGPRRSRRPQRARALAAAQAQAQAEASRGGLLAARDAEHAGEAAARQRHGSGDLGLSAGRRPRHRGSVPGPSGCCQAGRRASWQPVSSHLTRLGQPGEDVGQEPVMPGEGALQVPVVLVAVDPDPLGAQRAAAPTPPPVCRHQQGGQPGR